MSGRRACRRCAMPTVADYLDPSGCCPECTALVPLLWVGEEPLSDGERVRLAEAEAVIARGRRSYLPSGLALRQVRDERLYREGYGTFDAYLLERWEYRRSSGYDLIDAATIAERMSGYPDVDLANKSQALALRGLDLETAAAVYRKAAQAGRVTTAALRAARRWLAPDVDDPGSSGGDEAGDEPEPHAPAHYVDEDLRRAWQLVKRAAATAEAEPLWCALDPGGLLAVLDDLAAEQRRVRGVVEQYAVQESMFGDPAVAP